ncbi:MAG: hypothetical protein JWN70_4779 [Planctomycetaceae bacterium]|nr:hypothetical protein [Planctomycetaceae bacterium]
MRSGVFITCGLVLFTGCAQSNWQQAAVHSLVPGKMNVAAQERVLMVEKMLDETGVPERRPVPLLRAQSQDNSSVSLTSSSATKTPLISHDTATLTLIEKETREFAPGDRERAIAALKAIPSESVPAVLQLWKAGLISPLASPTSPVVTAQASAEDFESSIRLAAHDSSQVNAGLGQRSPWGNQTTRSSGYRPQDENESISVAAEPPAEPAFGRSQQINRVSHQQVGFSSPFPEMVAGPEISSATVAGSTGRRITIPPPWDSNRGRTTNPRINDGATPSMPADWPAATGVTTPRMASRGRHSDPFGETTQRPAITPPDWQNTAPQRPIATARGSAPIITPQVQPIPQQFERYRPEQTATDRFPVGVEQARFSNNPTGPRGAEIPLAPGQALPGFENSVPPLPPRLPIDQPVPRDRPQWVAPEPAAAPTPPAPNEALQFLIKATDSEVSQLVPGTTATELHYYIERHVYLRLLYLMSGQTEWALRPIPNIPGADQEFWTQVLWGIHNYFDMPKIPDHAERAAQTISQFNTAMLRLKERAPLELKNVTFCHKIEGYGEYNTYQKDEFTPGQRVLIYAEIGNFHSELSAEGIYRTRLKSTLQVFSADSPDEPVEVKTYPVTEDFCRNHRRDYFHSYVVDIPVRCARGSHVLKLVIEDELSGKVGTYSVPFTVR